MSTIQRTALYPLHEQQHAQFVEFHHWLMPLHYGSPLAEHMAVRTDAGVFDVSHMTIIDIMGAGCRQFLRHLMTRDIDEIQHMGGACYTCMCNEHGGIIDDVLIYYHAPDRYRLIFNAATKERVVAWLNLHAVHFHIGLQVHDDLCMLAIQGPRAFEKTLGLLDPYALDKVSTLKRFSSVEEAGFFFSRTGYTGEDGLEIILPKSEACAFFEKILAAGIKPCGLASRDSLRLEAGLMLNGQDMDEHISPLSAHLAWTISWKATDREFIGKSAILTQKDRNNLPRLVGLKLDARAILRHGQEVIHHGKIIGHITSGLYSPCLQKSIAFARIQSNETITHCEVNIRGQHYPVEVCSTRFYPLSSNQ